MDALPILLDGETVGRVQIRREGLYLIFFAECAVSSESVFHLFAAGERGKIPLGVPEPCGGKWTLTRRVSCREADAAGKLLRAELRRNGEEPGEKIRWQTAAQPERLFRSAFLKEQLRAAENVLYFQEAGKTDIALPYDRHRPFLLTSLFCFARVKTINGKAYAVFTFDRNENPVL